jgi:CHASE3 domain sensor protein
MSHPIDRANDDLDKVMRQLRQAVKGIPVRREGFKKLHDQFARSVAELSVNISYSRRQLPRR